MPDSLPPLPADYLAGIRLILAHRDYEAHEEIEQTWKRVSGREKLGCQAVLQLSVSRYQLARGNAYGALSNLRKVRRKLAAVGPGFWGVAVRAWLEALERFYAGLGLRWPGRELPFTLAELPPRESWPQPELSDALRAQLG